MAEHTKGPWRWQNEDECLVGPDQIVMRQDDEGRKSFADYPDGTTQANARLIAAAPDLLESLEELLPQNLGAPPDALQDHMTVPVDMTVGEIRRARAAIAKARGQS